MNQGCALRSQLTTVANTLLEQHTSPGIPFRTPCDVRCYISCPRRGSSQCAPGDGQKKLVCKQVSQIKSVSSFSAGKECTPPRNSAYRRAWDSRSALRTALQYAISPFRTPARCQAFQRKHRRRRGATLFRCRRIPLPTVRPLRAFLVFRDTGFNFPVGGVAEVRALSMYVSAILHLANILFRRFTHPARPCSAGLNSRVSLIDAFPTVFRTPRVSTARRGVLSIILFPFFPFLEECSGCARDFVGQRGWSADVRHRGRWKTGSLVNYSWMVCSGSGGRDVARVGPRGHSAGVGIWLMYYIRREFNKFKLQKERKRERRGRI
ncbi:hypothetical protein C8R45DRAFT_580354 [Mycena sanguinolenta]|nr:hypothetical protein C8R45DRAFT_580354 [Mycena sanguinolenta]